MQIIYIEWNLVNYVNIRINYVNIRKLIYPQWCSTFISYYLI